MLEVTDLYAYYGKSHILRGVNLKIEKGEIENIKAPEIAINYWNLPLHSTLKDVVKVIRDDEAGHRDVNHSFANILNIKQSKNIIEEEVEEEKEKT